MHHRSARCLRENIVGWIWLGVLIRAKLNHSCPVLINLRNPCSYEGYFDALPVSLSGIAAFQPYLSEEFP